MEEPCRFLGRSEGVGPLVLGAMLFTPRSTVRPGFRSKKHTKQGVLVLLKRQLYAMPYFILHGAMPFLMDFYMQVLVTKLQTVGCLCCVPGRFFRKSWFNMKKIRREAFSAMQLEYNTVKSANLMSAKYIRLYMQLIRVELGNLISRICLRCPIKVYNHIQYGL